MPADPAGYRPGKILMEFCKIYLTFCFSWCTLISQSGNADFLLFDLIFIKGAFKYER